MSEGLDFHDSGQSSVEERWGLPEAGKTQLGGKWQVARRTHGLPGSCSVTASGNRLKVGDGIIIKAYKQEVLK